MEKKYVLSLDQGTTSSRAILFDKNGTAVEKVSKEFKQIYPQPGWVEHDGEDIFSSVMYCIREVIEKAGIKAEEIDSLGITNQRETTLVWNKETGRPVHNAIVWQCRRTGGYCEELKERGYEPMIRAKTGLVADAYFSATKLKWLLDTVEGVKNDAQSGKLLFGTVDTYLMWRFSGGKIFATDYTNASRTMLYNIHERRWDEELLKFFSVPSIMLPEVFASSHLYGCTDPEIFGARIPVCGVAGDQQAALFGQLCTEKGSIKNTYGTGCFLLMNTGKTAVNSKRGLITTLAASLDTQPDYCLEGSVFVGGAVVQWLRDEMGLIATSAQSEELAVSVPDSGGVYFVPAFTGLGAPHWDASAKGMICGITRGTTKAHIVRAALESVAFQVFDVMHAMESDTGAKIKTLNVDGGASANDFLMRFQSGISSCEVVRPQMKELTSLGAAYLAGLKTGFFESVEKLKKLSQKSTDVFHPALDEDTRQKRLFEWETAVARTKIR